MWYEMVRCSTGWCGLLHGATVWYGEVLPALGVESILLVNDGTIDYPDRSDIKWGFVFQGLKYRPSKKSLVFERTLRVDTDKVYGGLYTSSVIVLINR